ncbi:UNVERIFIED_CONTAM: hypothetical protein FKN15_067757 [Acipenser sinensis]
MLADVGQRLIFPPEIATTNLRPDIVLWSGSARLVHLVELTVPWEDAVDEAYERKKLRYAQLATEAEQRGWRVRVYPVEVGCRGFVAHSTTRFLRDVGFSGQELRRTKSEHLCEIPADDSERKQQLPDREAEQNKLAYSVTDVPPWYLCIILGTQHYLTAFGGIIAIPLILSKELCLEHDTLTQSHLISTIFFVSGLCTLLQVQYICVMHYCYGFCALSITLIFCHMTSHFKTDPCGLKRLPILQGGTFTFLAPSLALLSMPQWKCPAWTQNATLVNTSSPEYIEVWQSRIRERTKGRCPKLESKWVGPCEVVERVGEVVYRIKMPPRGRHVVLHRDRMAPYLGRVSSVQTPSPPSSTPTPFVPALVSSPSSAPAPLAHVPTPSTAPVPPPTVPPETPSRPRRLRRRPGRFRDFALPRGREGAVVRGLDTADSKPGPRGLPTRVSQSVHLQVLKNNNENRRQKKKLQGSIMVASCFQIFVGFSGLIGLFMRFIGHLTIAPTSSLIGLSLFDSSGNDAGKHWGISALTVSIIVLFSQYLRHIPAPMPAYNKTKKFHSTKIYVFQILPVGSRMVIVTSGFLMICMGMFGKVAAIFTTIPTPVIGGSRKERGIVVWKEAHQQSGETLESEEVYSLPFGIGSRICTASWVRYIPFCPKPAGTDSGNVGNNEDTILEKTDQALPNGDTQL